MNFSFNHRFTPLDVYYLMGGYRERIEYENLGIKGLRNLGIDFKEKAVVER